MERFSINVFFMFALSLLSGMGCTGGLVEDGEEKARFITLFFDQPSLAASLLTTRTEAAPLPAGSTVRIAAYRIGESVEEAVSADLSVTAPTTEATYVIGCDGSLQPCLVDGNGKQIPGESSDMTVVAGVYDFYAVSPARPFTEVSEKRQITDIPHQEDVMTAFVRGILVSQSSRQVALGDFHRKCTQVLFEVAPTRDNIVPISSLCGTRLELAGVSTAGASLIIGENEKISPSGGDQTEAGKLSTTDFVTLPDPENPEEPSKLGLNRATTILLPKNGEPFQVAVTVARNGIAVTLKATIAKNIVFEEGKQYVFTLEVENDRSLLRLSVYDWTPFGLTDNNVGGAPDGRPTDPEVTPGTPFGLVVAGWDHISWTGGETIGGATIN